MKIIFLDHFGVMCLSNLNDKRDRNKLPSFDELKSSKPFDNFDADCVKILNSILKETDSEIVVSSDWKNLTSLSEMGNFYESQGIIKKPIDFTKNARDKSLTYQQNRCNEVNDYLKSKDSILNWVCIDDLHLSELSNFVWCEYPSIGINDVKIKDKILYFLGIFK